MAISTTCRSFVSMYHILIFSRHVTRDNSNQTENAQSLLSLYSLSAFEVALNIQPDDGLARKRRFIMKMNLIPSSTKTLTIGKDFLSFCTCLRSGHFICHLSHLLDCPPLL
ncbi:unnamed protein product [Brassica oleracea var. botrytis]